MKRPALFLTLSLLALFIACSKEETPKPAATPPAAVQAALNAATVADSNNGRKIYESICAACHASGLMHAPKVGAKDDWQGLIAEGVDTLVENTIRGKGSMPPKGGNPRLSDAEVRAAVEYMIEQSR